jgi:signal transduction histidine kinase
VSGLVDRAQSVYESNLRLKDEIQARQEAERQLKASEEKYRALFANMAKGFALGEPILDDQGRPVSYRLLEVNEAFFEQSGIPRDILGRPVREVLPHLEQTWIDRYGAVALRGQPNYFESYSADTRRHYEVHCFCPSTGRFAILFRDITEQRRIREALLDSEQRYKALFNNRTSAVAHLRVVADKDGKPGDYYFDAINDQWERLMGLRREQVVGRLATEVFPGLREQEWDPVEHLGHIALEGGEGIFDIHFRPTRQWVSIYAYSPKRGECTVMFTDITERKTAEAEVFRLNAELDERVKQRTAELQQANDALVKSNIELQRFAYVASHDLQTPPRTIVGFSQILKANLKDCLDRDNEMLLDQVIQATRRMHILIRDLLSYSRVESQAIPFQPVDSGEILQSVILTLSQSIQETGGQITHGQMPVVLGDPGQLAQVLQNLIENGIKYHGPEKPRIHVEAVRREEEWVFSVRDNGIGIAPRHFEKIFEVFKRLHSQHAYPGTGIGLAVCRRVIERHGGRIWIDSEPGKGSTFFFSIPTLADKT